MEQLLQQKLSVPLPRRSKVVLLAIGTVVTCVITLYLLFGESLFLAEPELLQLCNAHSPDCLLTPRVAAKEPLHKPKVLYYNTHGGAADNMAGVMTRIDVPLDLFNPKQVTGYGMSAKRARKLIDSGHVDFICSLYDIIIIGDTIPHGRALLQSLVEKNPAKRCKSVVIVEMTNRFDWDIKDHSVFYRLIRDLVRRSDKDLKGRVVFVANNNIEQAFLELRAGVHFAKPIPVLRPIGISKHHEYPDDMENPDFSNFAARTHDTTHIFHDMRDKHNIPLTIFPFNHKYGGPENLLRFRAFIDVPYQYSVMKFYENIAAGVPQFVPTPWFYEVLVN
ncbi:hypothetical protein HDU98_004433, partial [Podochytrium sp. JEL0797]